MVDIGSITGQIMAPSIRSTAPALVDFAASVLPEILADGSGLVEAGRDNLQLDRVMIG